MSTNWMRDYDLLVDSCWVKGCYRRITMRELNTSTYCKQHEANMLADLFGLPPKEECASNSIWTP